MKILAKFVADDGGATAVEYGLIVTFLAVMTLIAIQSTGSSMRAMFERISSTLS